MEPRVSFIILAVPDLEAAYVGEAVEREWGGYTGYFGDPAGYRWEVAYNPSPVGQSVLP